MPSVDQLAWSAGIEAASWITPRLTVRKNRVTDIVPSGFDAYVRILHPAKRSGRGHLPGPVRWREIAAWSGSELLPRSQFHSVALPVQPRHAAPPWRHPYGPRQGTLTPEDASTLIPILRASTATPETCRFCLGAMYGYEPVVVLADGTRRDDLMHPPEGGRLVVETPMPEMAYSRAKLQLPFTTCLLYEGPIATALTGYPGRPPVQTATLWWPDDRAWCVGSHPELLWTYVAGPEKLVARLAADPTLEALPVTVDAPVTCVEPWVLERAAEVVDEALEYGDAALSTSMGTVDVVVRRKGDDGSGSTRLEVDWHSVLGFGGERDGRTWPGVDDNQATRREMAAFVSRWVVALVGEWDPYGD